MKHNILDGLRKMGQTAEISSERGRMYAYNYSDEAAVFDVLKRTMGVKSFSPVLKFDYESAADIVQKCVEIFSDKLQGKKFAVRSRRAGGQNFSTQELNVMVGDALYKYSAGVDLKTPEVEVGIEVRNKVAYIYSQSIPGPGGLPLGSEAPLVALVSGGIDSPVAAWMLMKRGAPVDLVFVSLSHPIDTVEFIKAAKPLTERWSLGYDPFIHIIDGAPLIDLLVISSKIKVPGVTYKRIIYTIAAEIAKERRAFGIITGESLGQVSSQTPQNLLAINHSIDVPVYRPLIGLDKDEISDLARRIGTFPETSKGEFCALFSQIPVLDATYEEIDRDMQNFTILEQLLRNRITLHGSDLQKYLSGISDVDFEIRELPDNAVVVDLRAKRLFQEWHFNGALSASLGSIKELVESEGKDRIFVFYCQKGLQSAYAASQARKLGVRSYYTTSDKMAAMKAPESNNAVN